MGDSLDLRTLTTAGASGPVGDVDRRPRPLPGDTTGAAFLARPRLGTERRGAAAARGVELASAFACNKLPSSSCNRSIRSWISAAFLRVEEDSFTIRKLCSVSYFARNFR
jgi:hypothetical protein